jgi:hypothetical protein
LATRWLEKKGNMLAGAVDRGKTRAHLSHDIATSSQTRALNIVLSAQDFPAKGCKPLTIGIERTTQ